MRLTALTAGRITQLCDENKVRSYRPTQRRRMVHFADLAKYVARKGKA